MNYLKTNPVGIDIAVQGFQKVLYSQLKKVWGVTDDTSIDVYGRIYNNPTADGSIPEFYDATTSNYTEVLTDDRLKALCFFGIEDQQKYDKGSSAAKAFLIVMLDLSKIKPLITDHRPDEEVRIDVQNICAQPKYGFTFTGIETGKKIFREYSGFRIEDIKYSDMNQLHYFRINFDLLYNIHDC